MSESRTKLTPVLLIPDVNKASDDTDDEDIIDILTTAGLIILAIILFGIIVKMIVCLCLINGGPEDKQPLQSNVISNTKF